MNGGDGGISGYNQQMRERALTWMETLHEELKNLVQRTPPDVDRVAISFAQQLERLLNQIEVLEYFLGEGEISPITTRAQRLVEASLGD